MSEDKKNTKAEESAKGPAVASLVLGIVGVVTCWAGFFSLIGFICAIIGIVLAVKARKIAKTGLSTAGLVLSIIGTCLGGIGMICTVCVLCAAGSAGILDAASNTRLY